ncbi:hypothetical protein SKAU_G00292230 [Synaphobranchus kaupii]|uniref:PDZ domain-containing protein n=1 Tax=Synaphobranchus kaupii TaxID=118154 RepID=A0A9Q1EU48_SYNKA|nr:hypothetical protein SKAU_G00292230 [Synaphobranchus kaupii]
MRRFLRSQKGRFSLRQSKSGTRSASKDFILTMPLSNQGWPEEFGFRLGGSGPSYILSVEDSSSAHMAGLQAGDQVLEIEGQDVSDLSPQALASLAQKQKNVPPSIGVVSRIQHLDIAPGPDGRFGFTIVGDRPLLVEDCMPNSPAGRCGLRAGDFVMEVNGIPVKQHETAAAVIKASQGRTLRLGVLGMGRRLKRTAGGSLKEPGSQGGQQSGLQGTRQGGLLSSLQGGWQGAQPSNLQVAQPNSLQGDQPGRMQGNLLAGLQGGLQGAQPSSLQSQQGDVQGPVSLQSSDSVRQDRKNKAVEFNKKVEEILGAEPEVKEQLFAVLKQYAAERKVDILASALPRILTSEEHQQLFETIRSGSQLSHPATGKQPGAQRSSKLSISVPSLGSLLPLCAKGGEEYEKEENRILGASRTGPGPTSGAMGRDRSFSRHFRTLADANGGALRSGKQRQRSPVLLRESAAVNTTRDLPWNKSMWNKLF